MPRRGFTLLELIAVVVIVLVLAVAGAEGISAMAQSSAVTSNADRIRRLLDDAREMAVTQNCAVEVRFYDATPLNGYIALQPRWNKADKTTPPAATAVVLPSWVVIDSTAAHSTLIAANTQTATLDASDARLNSDTKVFHFLPDGSTDLDPSLHWFLTVRPANQSDPAHFPANWACITVDGASGRTQIYRP